MIHYTHGNLLDADVEALVNTVNTVGVMGKGIALMFKEQYPENFEAYAAACEQGEVQTGRMLTTSTGRLYGPRLIINFPTKSHWRPPSKIEWIDAGLADLRRVLTTKGVKSVAIPPLGSGNGKLDWSDVRPLVERHLADLDDVEIYVFEPTRAYHNVSKTTGVEQLTPARAMIAEMVRRYEVLGLDCSVLEIQKLAWVLNRTLNQMGLANPLKLAFAANRYGPYADSLRHLLNALDGSYLHCDKRLADASPTDTIHFAPTHASKLRTYWGESEGSPFVEVINRADTFIDGFQSPLGMEALATVGWLVDEEGAQPTLESIRAGIEEWPHGDGASERKQRLFGDSLLQAAIDRIKGVRTH